MTYMKYLLFALILVCKVYAEPIDTTLKKLEGKKVLIDHACQLFDVNSKILSAIILTERSLNYDWMDESLDFLLAKSGRNTSIGFCQIKLKTAYWIERQLADSTSEFFPGSAYEDNLPVSKSPRQIITKLSCDSLNIYYAAAYICIISSYWKNSGYPISKKADILGTLYSAGLFLPNGMPRKPNNHPRANFFGKKVLQFLNKILF